MRPTASIGSPSSLTANSRIPGRRGQSKQRCGRTAPQKGCLNTASRGTLRSGPLRRRSCAPSPRLSAPILESRLWCESGGWQISTASCRLLPQARLWANAHKPFMGQLSTARQYEARGSHCAQRSWAAQWAGILEAGAISVDHALDPRSWDTGSSSHAWVLTLAIFHGVKLQDGRSAHHSGGCCHQRAGANARLHGVAQHIASHLSIYGLP